MFSDRCFDARHVRCHDTTCTCTCHADLIDTFRTLATQRPRRHRRTIPRKASSAPHITTPTRAGRSSIDPRLQRIIEIMVSTGGGQAEIARVTGASRDQVRTIAWRMEGRFQYRERQKRERAAQL